MSTCPGNPLPVARLEKVLHRYGNTKALDDVGVEIPAGCMVGFIGPDGVGKSTLLGLVSGARKVQTGSVEVLSGDMTDDGHRNSVSPRIAYMPQGLGRNLYPDLSVVENVDFFGRLFGQSRNEREKRIDDLLISTGLAPFHDRPARNLSGGMKQKLGLCCALIHDPDLLILDEPTTGVDPLSRRQFWELIDRMRSRREGMSVLIATAYMDEAEEFDWLVMMDDGRIPATGTPDQLKSQTGAGSLEDAYVVLLPDEKRRGHRTFSIPPLKPRPGGPAIEAHDLTRRFGDFTAVDHVSFHIERGEIFGFLGPNGCGKTTTMKMLTGLLPATEGECMLFGSTVEAGDMEIRKRIGYMSQSFSLYLELTVRQNLKLHARLYQLPKDEIEGRVSKLVERFGLGEVLDHLAEKLPLGMRQRLSLAVAVIHKPDILILDEPTSGVDPVARDGFWELLVDLSRNAGVTIFVSTHFMNEGGRCDRISLMNAGRVLTTDAPPSLIQECGAKSLQDAFIAYIEEDQREANGPPEPERTQAVSSGPFRGSQAGPERPQSELSFDPRRLLAYAMREALELWRDPVRLSFSLLVPLMLLIVLGYGISLDVENLSYSVLDRDQTPESRTYLENLSGSRYFRKQSSVDSYAQLERPFLRGDLTLAIEVPPNFGKDLKRGRKPEIGVWIDGGMPFRAEITRGYVHSLHQRYQAELARRSLGWEPRIVPAAIETRFRYNQDMKSIFAIVPGVIALLLVVITAMLTALGVVREKEKGSIANLYATPVTRLEFLVGKQLPYIVTGLITFLALVVLTILLFGVPLKGSFPALAAGAVLYVTASSGIGFLVSTFTKTQVAAIVATLIITLVPAIHFSGLTVPVSSLTGGASVLGHGFPMAYFLKISVGTFTKALDFGDLLENYAVLGIFVIALTLVSLILLKKQET